MLLPIRDVQSWRGELQTLLARLGGDMVEPHLAVGQKQDTTVE